MNNIKLRALKITEALKNEYPDAECSLNCKNGFELLISTRLSAQCTDKRVNQITKILFEKYPTAETMASASIEDLENIVKPAGLYHTKARDIKNIAVTLFNKYGGEIPDTMDELLKLPGVGRKTASLILGEIFKQPAIVTDTHCIRLSNRMGLTTTSNPYKVELELGKLIEPENQLMFCHRLVHHGRAVCRARNPECDNCCVSDLCEYKKRKK